MPITKSVLRLTRAGSWCAFTQEDGSTGGPGDPKTGRPSGTLKRGMASALISEHPSATLHGLGTAIVTPFHPDESVDHDSLRRLVQAQAAAGVDFVVACGSTGEASTLSEDETDAVITTVMEAADGGMPVVAGCTHNSTREAVRRVERIARIPGLHGILSANPYYNKPGQMGQYLHFKAIAEATDKALVLYNIPGRTAANLDVATVLRLAELPNVVGIKESSGNLQTIGDLLSNVQEGFSVFAGDDYLALPIIASGGKGLISVTANAAPAQVAQLVRTALEHDVRSARSHARTLHALNQALFTEPNPSPVKALLEMMGAIGSNTVRLPMVPAAPETQAKLRAIAEPMGLLEVVQS